MIDYEAALSPRVKGIAPSGIRKFFDLLENMDSSDAISLGVGEPDFVTPWHIRDAGVYALEKGFTKYTSNAGLAELRRLRRYGEGEGRTQQKTDEQSGGNTLDCLFHGGILPFFIFEHRDR